MLHSKPAVLVHETTIPTTLIAPTGVCSGLRLPDVNFTTCDCTTTGLKSLHNTPQNLLLADPAHARDATAYSSCFREVRHIPQHIPVLLLAA